MPQSLRSFAMTSLGRSQNTTFSCHAFTHGILNSASWHEAVRCQRAFSQAKIISDTWGLGLRRSPHRGRIFAARALLLRDSESMASSQASRHRECFVIARRPKADVAISGPRRQSSSGLPQSLLSFAMTRFGYQMSEQSGVREHFLKRK